MARPRKLAAELRDRRFNLRYTAAEFAHLRLQAQRAGLDLHVYARRRTLGLAAVGPAARRADPALISELNRIGVNINQLARAAHMGRDFTGTWDAMASELKRTLAVVMACDGA